MEALLLKCTSTDKTVVVCCLQDKLSSYERLNVLYERNWTRLVHEQLRKFETSVVAATKIEGYDGKDLLDSERQWSFSGALLYSVTVITTIGYGNLAPKTPEGKVVTMLYAVFGVPLMLLCLSSLGTLLADTFQLLYSHVCCAQGLRSRHRAAGGSASATRHSSSSDGDKRYNHSYHRAPSVSPSHHGSTGNNKYTRSKHESSMTSSCTSEAHEVQVPPARKALLATVNARGRPRLQAHALTAEVHQLLGAQEMTEHAHAHAHAQHIIAAHWPRPPPPGAVGPLCKPPHCPAAMPQQLINGGETSDDDGEDSETNQGMCSHDTPSRIPLIWRPPDSGESSGGGGRRSSPTPSISTNTYRVPIIVVIMILVGYVCLGAFVFAAWEDWSFLDGAYFCFITLSTIGFGDLVPGKTFQQQHNHHATDRGQLQLIACCGYLLLGLVIVAMSFSLVQEEVLAKCRHAAITIGIIKHH